MKRTLIAAGLLATLTAAPVHAQAMFASPALSVAELDAQRGGFDLPGGGVITLGVTTTTRIDGQEILRTVFAIRDGTSRVTVLGNRDGSLTPLAAASLDGDGAQTADGTVRVRSGDSGVRVEFAGDRIAINLLAGQAFGSVIANSASDRSIDVSTTLDIGLSGVRPDAIGGSMASVDTLALDATSRMIH